MARQPSKMVGNAELAGVEGNTEAARSALTSVYSAAKTIWITEIGWPVEYGDSAHPNVTEADQASLLTNSFNWLKGHAESLKINSIIWYFYRDINVPTWYGHTGLRTISGNFRPSWQSFIEEAGVTTHVALQANTGDLWVYSPISGAKDLLLGMGSSASTPAITGGPPRAGTYEVAFKADTGYLWTYSSTNGAKNLQLGMAANTSPSIAHTSTGNVIAFQANTGDLWIYDGSKATDTFLGLAPGTSPSIAALQGGGCGHVSRLGK
jgi:hypothetical protein